MTCPSCGHDNRPRAKYCEECGSHLAALPVRPATALEPQSYTPRHLTEKILSQRSALEGERKQVTVLFADVKESMAIAAELEAEQWHRILNRFFVILGDAIHRFEGTINQYTGDGIMALFGAPIAHEDHARRACYAALALRADLRSYAEELKRTAGLNFSVRMGLHSGEVVVGRIGDDLRMDYTAQGHTVGLAQRMEQLAAPGNAYLTAATAKLVEGFFNLRDLGEFEIRGVRPPVRVFELGDIGRLRTRFDLSRSRGLSRFVGRVDEMDLLEATLERSLAGEAQIVSLVGEAGVGKSRLSFEFLERCRARGIRVAEGAAVSHGRSVPLLPWLSVFRSSFGVDERDKPAVAREKVAGRAVLWDSKLSGLLPVVFDFMGIQDPSALRLEMDPDARKRKLLEFVCRASEARNRQQGGVLLWEDLHWLDPASDEILGGWLEAIAGTRTLVVTNYRPEYRARWAGWSNHTTIRLRPLDASAARALLADLLGTDRTVAALPQMIEERTRGNPFFIEEVVQSLIERGDLRGKRGAYRLTTAVRSLAIPGSVRAVLAARIDRLSDDQKALLQAASVLGKTFEEPVLEKTTGLPRSQLAGPLASLQSSEMILEEALYPVRRFAFKHPLTQEVAYHSQLQDQRAKIHRAAARAIADLHADTLDEKAALLAQHHEQGGETLAAARCHARAAAWIGTRDIPEARRHDRRVIELTDRLPHSQERDEIGISARARLLHHAWRSGMEADEEDRIYHEGTQIAERLNDERLRASVAIPYGVAVSTRGNERGREEISRVTYERAMELGDRQLALMALVPLATSLLVRGKLPDLMMLLDRHADDLLEHPADTGFWEFSPGTFLVGLRGQARTALGDFPSAVADAEDSIVRATRDGRTEGTLNAHLHAAEIHFWAGNAAIAETRAQTSLDLAESHGAPTYVALAHCHAAQAQTLLGSTDTAVGHARHARETIHAYGLTGLASQCGQILAAALLPHEPAAAADTARETIDLALRVGQPIWRTLTLPVLAQATPTNATTLLADADATMRAFGLEGYRPLVDEAAASIAALSGDAHEARRLFGAAERAWARMRAPGRAEWIRGVRQAL